MRTTWKGATVIATVAIIATGCTPATQPAEEGSGYPADGQVVTLVVPFDAGGITDVFARLVAPEIEEALGATVVVENQPGAGGQVGLTAMLSEPADGSAIGFTNLPSTLAYLDPARAATYDADDFTPLGGIGISPTVLAVAADGPYETLDDLVAAAEADPGAIALGTGGSGASDDYLASVELEETADVDLNLVTFEGGSADKTTALLGGDVAAIMGSVGGILPQIASGDVRLIAVATDERSSLIADVPTFAEQGLDVTISGTLNLSGPAGMPDDVVAAIAAAIEEAAGSPELVDAAAAAGFEIAFASPDELADRWSEQQALVEPLFS